MLKIFDVRCESCGNTEEQWLESPDSREPCTVCSGNTIREFTKFTFELKYDPKKDTVGWGVHGYNESHYWDDVKKERSAGRDVKPALG